MVDTAQLGHLRAVGERDGIQQFVVGGVVCDGGDVLLLRRPGSDFMGGIFELPSGKVEPGEDLDAALVREVKEETGLDVTEISGYLGCFDYRSGSGKRSRQLNFTVDVAVPGPIELQEHDTYRWTPISGVLPVTDEVKTVLTRYQELLGW